MFNGRFAVNTRPCCWNEKKCVAICTAERAVLRAVFRITGSHFNVLQFVHILCTSQSRVRGWKLEGGCIGIGDQIILLDTFWHFYCCPVGFVVKVQDGSVLAVHRIAVHHLNIWIASATVMVVKAG